MEHAKPLNNYVLHCTFGDSDKVRVVGACGATPQEAFRSIIGLWTGINDTNATLLRVANETPNTTWDGAR